MSSGKELDALTKLFTTPQKEGFGSTGMRNSSRNFQSSARHRKSIFKQPLYSSSSKKPKIIEPLVVDQQLQHFEIRNVLSDDFCGCQTTLETCKRITKNYFDKVSVLELKKSYESIRKPSYPISTASKKVFFSQLPEDYPEIYHSHLSNVLDHFQAKQLTDCNFLLLAWVQFHCKFEYVTYFFYADLKESMQHFKFYDKLELALIKENTNFIEQKQYYYNLGLDLNKFLQEFRESVGAVMVPVSQYARFLEIVKQKGPNALVQLIALFLSKKSNEMYNVLKYWTQNQITSMRNYSRFLNWDIFFEQINSSK